MLSSLEDDLCCAVCQEIFKNPVVLSCSHSFCRTCLQRWWSGKRVQKCPLCKRRSSTEQPPCNLVLKNLCEAFIKEDQRTSAGSAALCSLHAERLKLFCLDHQQPVCVICRESRAHTKHTFRPISEMAQEHREELRGHLEPFHEKLKLFQDAKGNFEQMAEHIQVQARHTEGHIKEMFKKLRRFLQEEEEARLAALSKEEEQKSQKIKNEVEVLSKEIAATSDTIRATEEHLGAEDISLVLNHKAAAERVRQRPLLDSPVLSPGGLIDVAEHLGNLSFKVWNKMREMVSYCPVVLDPNTAHPELLVSEDLSSVSFGKEQKLPENPERFDLYRSVLSSQGFCSGVHSWDVEVRSEYSWGVGMAVESGRGKGVITKGFWVIWFTGGQYKAFSPSVPGKILAVKKLLQRIRVCLDWSKGELSFCDPDPNTHIHTFTHTFTETLYPYIYTLNNDPLKILPARVTTSVKRRL